MSFRYEAMVVSGLLGGNIRLPTQHLDMPEVETAMGIESSIVFTGIAPHPPIMVPEVGGEASNKVSSSITAMAEFTRRIVTSGAETVVLISPHAPLDARAFVAYSSPQLYADFTKFRSPSTKISFDLDQQILQALSNTAEEKGYDVLTLDDSRSELDHGSAVPLYFLNRYGWNGRIVSLGYSYLSNADHLNFGECIKTAVDSVGRPVAVVASGDLSHRLRPDAPAGFNPRAHLFDSEVVAALRAHSPERIINIDQDMRRMAGECGYRSMLVALGAIQGLRGTYEVLSYEAPFGVGYLVAQLMNTAVVSESDSKTSVGELSADPETVLPTLARQAVETFVRTGQTIDAPQDKEILSARAACFVTLRVGGAKELRGCIGTIDPAMDTLGEEIIANAIKAASRDPRFEPVSERELPDLSYSVDVLSAPEPASFEGLNPEVYGIIVENESGSSRGLLLPDIEGVDTVEQQVQIAASKAGIQRRDVSKLFRFRVVRYREKK